MKTKILSIIAVAAIAIGSLSSCGKYEEGPGLSLRSKKARVTGEWKVTEMKQDGEVLDLAAFNVSMEMEFKKDDSYVSTTVQGDETEVEKGTWEFTDKKEGLSMKAEGETKAEENTIIRLTNSEMWIESEETEGTVTIKTEVKLEKK